MDNIVKHATHLVLLVQDLPQRNVFHAQLVAFLIQLLINVIFYVLQENMEMFKVINAFFVQQLAFNVII